MDKQVAGKPIEYLYDANGNQAGDLNKGIAWARYNLLNLPVKVQFSNGNKTDYAYDATGVKRQVMYSTTLNQLNIPMDSTGQENMSIMYTTKEDYCGRYVYENNVLKRIVTPEGYLRLTGLTASGIRYTYNLKDHLGCTYTNLVSDAMTSPTSTNIALTSTSNYYPSGMEIRPIATNNSGVNPYLYGGKELDRMSGLNEYDFRARWYDYADATFTTPDPLAENHCNESPYSYCGGNPVNRTDPTGLDWYKYSKDGKYYFMEDDDPRLKSKEKGVTYSYTGETVYYAEDGHMIYGDQKGVKTIGLAECVTLAVHRNNNNFNFLSTFTGLENVGNGNGNTYPTTTAKYHNNANLFVAKIDLYGTKKLIGISG